MDIVKNVLTAREHKSPQVQLLLQCLQDPSFGLQVYICSVGGVGSTELSNFLTRAGISCNLLTDQDGLRHINRPPASLPAGTRVVYLFGDPLSCVASHYRRQHAYHQALKTSGNPSLDEDLFPMTFVEYVDRGEDLFGLEQHIHNWLDSPAQYDVLFIRYEHMFDLPVAEAMFRYICCTDGSNARLKSEEAVSAMAAAFAAQKRQRSSRVTTEQQQAMYVQLTANIDSLPHIFLRSKDGTHLPLVAA